MKTLYLIVPLAAALGSAAVPVSALDIGVAHRLSAGEIFAARAQTVRSLTGQRALELEPCINGAVSATGLYATQAEENAALQRYAGH